MSFKQMKRIKASLEIVGLCFVGLGVVLGFVDLKGWFQSSDRQALLHWVHESKAGLPIEEPAAQAFKRRFPPPLGGNGQDITHITKSVVRLADGTVTEASLNYLYRDGTRTNHVATLPDIRKWAEETPYPWLAWFVTVLGFLQVAASAMLDRRLERRQPKTESITA